MNGYHKITIQLSPLYRYLMTTYFKKCRKWGKIEVEGGEKRKIDQFGINNEFGRFKFTGVQYEWISYDNNTVQSLIL